MEKADSQVKTRVLKVTYHFSELEGVVRNELSSKNVQMSLIWAIIKTDVDLLFVWFSFFNPNFVDFYHLGVLDTLLEAVLFQDEVVRAFPDFAFLNFQIDSVHGVSIEELDFIVALL